MAAPNQYICWSGVEGARGGELLQSCADAHCSVHVSRKQTLSHHLQICAVGSEVARLLVQYEFSIFSLHVGSVHFKQTCMYAGPVTIPAWLFPQTNPDVSIVS